MNYILIYSIEGKESNTEKNFYEGLDCCLQKHKIRFVSMDNSTKPRRDFSIEAMSMQEYIKNNKDTVNVFIFVIHDDDRPEQKTSLDTTYNYITQEWSKIINTFQDQKKGIEFKIDRVFDIGVSFDFLIWSFIGENKQDYIDSQFHKSSKKRANKRLFYNMLNIAKIDSNDLNLSKIIYDKIAKIPSNHSKIISKIINLDK